MYMKNEFQMINLEFMKFLQSTVNIKYVTLLINFITESSLKSFVYYSNE